MLMPRTKSGIRVCCLKSIAQDIVERFDNTNKENLRDSLKSCLLVRHLFFVYAESRRWCRAGIAYSIKSPPVRAGSFLSDGPQWQDVLRLVASVLRAFFVKTSAVRWTY